MGPLLTQISAKNPGAVLENLWDKRGGAAILWLPSPAGRSPTPKNDVWVNYNDLTVLPHWNNG